MEKYYIQEVKILRFGGLPKVEASTAIQEVKIVGFGSLPRAEEVQYSLYLGNHYRMIQSLPRVEACIGVDKKTVVSIEEVKIV